MVRGGIFEALRQDRKLFEQVRVEDGIVVWPNGADICPDVLIWGGAPPEGDEAVVPDALVIPRFGSHSQVVK